MINNFFYRMLYGNLRKVFYLCWPDNVWTRWLSRYWVLRVVFVCLFGRSLLRLFAWLIACFCLIDWLIDGLIYFVFRLVMEREMRSRGEVVTEERFLLPHYKTFHTKAGGGIHQQEFLFLLGVPIFTDFYFCLWKLVFCTLCKSFFRIR